MSWGVCACVCVVVSSVWVCLVARRGSCGDAVAVTSALVVSGRWGQRPGRREHLSARWRADELLPHSLPVRDTRHELIRRWHVSRSGVLR